MSRKKDQRKIERIRKRILKSGFPLEIEIGNILRRNGWLVGNQWPYIDKTSGKIRPVDLLAMKMRLQQPPLGVLLLIECKKSLKHEWVFHTQQKQSEFLPLLGTLVDFIKKFKSFPFVDKLIKLTAEDILTSKLSRLHLFDNRIKVGVFNISVPKSKDDFHEATMQIISALESMSEGMRSFVIFPTIVFDGEIFEFYQENAEDKIMPIDHLQLMSYQKAPAGMFPCLIDVVRKTYFSEFLRMIERDYYIFTQLFKLKGA